MAPKFIVFEGPDGSGKSTLLEAVSAALRARTPGLRIVHTREPGGTALGLELRRILKSPELQGKTDPVARRVLFEVDRIQHQRELRDSGADVVLSDRHCPVSNSAYGEAEGSDDELICRIEAMDSERMLPDLCVLIDIEPCLAWERIHRRETAEGNVDPAERDRRMFDKVHRAYQAFILDAEEYGSFFTTAEWEIPAVSVQSKALSEMVAEIMPRIIAVLEA